MVPELWPSVIRRELVEPEFALKDGVITLPRTPGLGVRLNEAVARKLAWPAGFLSSLLTEICKQQVIPAYRQTVDTPLRVGV